MPGKRTAFRMGRTGMKVASASAGPFPVLGWTGRLAVLMLTTRAGAGGTFLVRGELGFIRWGKEGMMRKSKGRSRKGRAVRPRMPKVESAASSNQALPGRGNVPRKDHAGSWGRSRHWEFRSLWSDGRWGPRTIHQKACHAAFPGERRGNARKRRRYGAVGPGGLRRSVAPECLGIAVAVTGEKGFRCSE